jgi:hypothetical protein
MGNIVGPADFTFQFRPLGTPGFDSYHPTTAPKPNEINGLRRFKSSFVVGPSKFV